jgi:hypothetical protein
MALAQANVNMLVIASICGFLNASLGGWRAVRLVREGDTRQVVKLLHIAKRSSWFVRRPTLPF